MFVLAELKDTVRIAPELFNLKLPEAIKDEVNRKLANKVSNLFLIIKGFTTSVVLHYDRKFSNVDISDTNGPIFSVKT